MEKSIFNKQRKYGIPFLVAACLLFLAAAIALYFVTADESVSYYYEDGSELTLVSAAPDGEGGVSQDSSVVLEWNRPVSIDFADEITIRPSARGKWSVSGNQLIFTPQQLAAGTYYTVSVPKGARLNDRGDVLKEDIFFSFETEDPELRLPDTEGFAVERRSFCFSPEESAVIPVTLISEKETAVEVKILKAESSDDFIDAFAPLFAFPAWAELSVDRYRVSQRNFNEISEKEITVTDNGKVSCVDLGVLPAGQYLVELSAAGGRRDVAVTVSDLDLGMVCDNGVLAVWARENGEACGSREITVAGKKQRLDENGFLSLSCDYDRKKMNTDPSSLAVTVADKTDDAVFFLTADEVTPVYDGELFLDSPKLTPGRSLTASGAVFSPSGVAMNDKATLLFCSGVGVVESVDVSLENGFFSHQWENLSLSDGEYRLLLIYHGKTLATDMISVGGEKSELQLSVTKSAQRIQSGETVTYRVSVTDHGGNPVTDAKVSLNGDDGVAVDENGVAVFRKEYQVGRHLSYVQKDAVFRVASPYGDAEAVTASVSVYASSRSVGGDNAAPRGETVGEFLNLSLTNGFFTVATEEETPSFRLTYDSNKGTYDMKAIAETVGFDLPESISVNAGETIAISDTSSSVFRRITAVSLCSGTVPAALCGKNIYDENLHDQVYGTLEETRVFFGDEPLEAAFSTENRSGEYFLRIASKDLRGNTVSRYIPVVINGVTLACPDNASYVYSKNLKLPFRVSGDEELEYCLTVGEEEYSDTATGDFSVNVSVNHTGTYPARIELRKDDVTVASGEFSFFVYQKSPMFLSVKEGYDEKGFFRCQVREESVEDFLTAFEIMALPGDQILQTMGKTLVYQTFGNQVGSGLTDLNFDLTSLQNSDGGFGRFENADSDLLLSVLVAEQEEFVCDRASLCTYLKYRLATADNPETAALACWGLACFDYDCSESMAMIEDRSDRVLLYLAEGYEAAGNNGEARHIYKLLQRELQEDGEKLHMPKIEDQYHIANTAFMLDLALKLNQPEAKGLQAFLTDANIETQTGRYLLLSAILRSAKDDAVVMAQGKKAEDGYQILSFAAAELSDVASLKTYVTQNGDIVTGIRRGETAELHVEWEKTNNSIYLVYAGDTRSASIIEKDGVVFDRGYDQWITDGGSAVITFAADRVGENEAPRVYVVNLTTGKLVGVADLKEWVVKK